VPSHKDVLGSRRIARMFLTSAQERGDQLHTPTALSSETKVGGRQYWPVLRLRSTENPVPIVTNHCIDGAIPAAITGQTLTQTKLMNARKCYPLHQTDVMREN
jgi:hypothetical protein